MKEPKRLTRNVLRGLAAVHRDRWLQSPWSAMLDLWPLAGSSMAEWPEWFHKSMAVVGESAHDRADYRGLVISPYRGECRIEGLVLKNTDLSFSEFGGVCFERCTFENCLFSSCIFDAASFRCCKFSQCDFTGCLLFEFSGFGNCVVTSTSFRGTQTGGKHFYIGSDSLWCDCDCTDCVLERWATAIDAVRFKRCRFSGRWSEAHFVNRSSLLMQGLRSGLGNFIGSLFEKPAVFDACDFTGLELDAVVFEPGVILPNCKAAPKGF